MQADFQEGQLEFVVGARLVLFLRKDNLEAKEMTRLLKCFSYEVWEPELISQHPCKKPGVLVCICNPNAGQDEMRDSLMLESQASQRGNSKFSVKPSSKQECGEQLRKTPHVDQPLLCEHK